MWMGIGDAIQHWAQYAPDKPALTVGELQHGFKSLFIRATSIGTHLSNHTATGRVAVGVEDKFDYIASLVGLHLARIPIVVLNPHEKEEALKVHLADTLPCAIIGHPQLLSIVESEATYGIKGINSLEIPTISDAKPANMARNKEWGVLFSSGSTGISKAIVYDQMAMTSELLAWCLELGIRRGSRFYVGRPIHYTGGLVLTLATLLVGGEVILPDPKDDDDFEAIWHHYQTSLRDRSIDFAFFVPNQLRTFLRLANDPLGGPTILTMGAPISGDDKKAASHTLRSPVVESWGNSEGLGTITDKDDLFDRPNSIGRPFLTERMCIVTDDLVECEAGQKGRLAGSDETMFKEYANRPDATERAKKQNLVLSDDIGYMDEKHYFYILGRDQESFVVDGQMVFLADLEERIRLLPGTNDVCVVCTAAQGVQSFRALIVRDESVLEDTLAKEVQDTLNVNLAGITFVDALPRLSSGKIDRLEAAKLVR